MAQQLSHVPHQLLFISRQPLWRCTVRDGLDGGVRESGLSRQTGMGDEFVLAVDLPN
jgi:hypothetical protein